MHVMSARTVQNRPVLTTIANTSSSEPFSAQTYTHKMAEVQKARKYCLGNR